MIVSIYARVSSDRQKDAETISSQLLELREFARREDLKLMTGMSNAIMERLGTTWSGLLWIVFERLFMPKVLIFYAVTPLYFLLNLGDEINRVN